MLIAADENFGIAGNCAFNEFIIIRIFTYRDIKPLSIHEATMYCNQLDKW
jgi:hypothetical protein